MLALVQQFQISRGSSRTVEMFLTGSPGVDDGAVHGRLVEDPVVGPLV